MRRLSSGRGSSFRLKPRMQGLLLQLLEQCGVSPNVIQGFVHAHVLDIPAVRALPAAHLDALVGNPVSCRLIRAHLIANPEPWGETTEWKTGQRVRLARSGTSAAGRLQSLIGREGTVESAGSAGVAVRFDQPGGGRQGSFRIVTGDVLEAAEGSDRPAAALPARPSTARCASQGAPKAAPPTKPWGAGPGEPKKPREKEKTAESIKVWSPSAEDLWLWQLEGRKFEHEGMTNRIPSGGSGGTPVPHGAPTASMQVRPPPVRRLRQHPLRQPPTSPSAASPRTCAALRRRYLEDQARDLGQRLQEAVAGLRQAERAHSAYAEKMQRAGQRVASAVSALTSASAQLGGVGASGPYAGALAELQHSAARAKAEVASLEAATVLGSQGAEGSSDSGSDAEGSEAGASRTATSPAPRLAATAPRLAATVPPRRPSTGGTRLRPAWARWPAAKT
eukprot:TRINITY_DN55776_c0_g1_i1.p1 TRINITY_DN55776_c0_g1~~TRINITY_DN55776_c0_g1_i1.p1  ORF type:complete len:449 (+),score=61.22 TRINITY_DN55776_c0_g1_i1:93-1439(+)